MYLIKCKRFLVPKYLFLNSHRASETTLEICSIGEGSLAFGRVASRAFLAEEKEEDAIELKGTDSRSRHMRNVFVGLLKMRFAAGDTVRHRVSIQ